MPAIKSALFFQHHNLLDCLTAWENVSTSLRLHSRIPKRAYRARAVAMLNAVGLGDKVDAYPKSCRGGRSSGLRSPAPWSAIPNWCWQMSPRHPWIGQSGRDVVDIMQRLAREEGCTVLLVTHDNRILDIADRILHMEDGRLM